MVYQEQVMQIVRDLAGYSLGRADLVRRAMGKKKLDVMAKEREYFIHGQTDENGNVIIPGCVRNGIDEASANKIFDEMAEFAKYAFNKSHAAAYAVVSYRTAYLKTYYPTEFMAATLNSFLGNLDKVPEYIDECRRIGIKILNPSINKSYTKFAVYGNDIRFGLGSVKNVGIGAVDAIVKERKRNGEYKSFTDFCERISGEAVNKKCIESLIKAGAFDELGQTRATLMASFERILDTINNANKKSMKGQVTLFDIVTEDKTIEENKYTFTTLPEYSEKEILSMEKEMLGIYISGHPLEKYKNLIKKVATIDTLKMAELQEIEDPNFDITTMDGKPVKFAGIVTSVKKKYTKNNTIMAFVTVEDLYGPCEIIVFDSCYGRANGILLDENIVIVEGRLSVREDEDIKIVANNIRELTENEITRNENKVENTVSRAKMLTLDITNLEEEQKAKLRGAIRFFSGEKSNIAVQVLDNGEYKPCGTIYINNEILEQFEEILGKDRVKAE